MHTIELSSSQRGLHRLAGWLKNRGYAFVTVTPETHRRVLQHRGAAPAACLRDVFGWNLAFDPRLLPPDMQDALREADALETLQGGRVRSRVRFASLDGIPYVHSAYPTDAADAVFCGPDTYRFVALVQRQLAGSPALKRVVDVGCGAGAGGLTAASFLRRTTGRVPRIELVDMNAKALAMAQVNAVSFGIDHAAFLRSDLYRDVEPGVDLIVANPPYLVDDGERLYRHGGGPLGTALSERIVKEGLPLLAEGGKLILYTGSPIVEGEDRFRAAALRWIDPQAHVWTYDELDPDVFGEELDRPAYQGIDRIAVVALVVRRRKKSA